MTNYEVKFLSEIRVSKEYLNVVNKFKYLGRIIDDKE